MLIWRISGSLRLSQNFVKIWKFSWPRSLEKFQILTNFSSLSFLTCEDNCKSQNGILECSYLALKDFWKFEVELNFCQKLKIFMTAVLSEISDFDQFFITLISDSWVNCKSQNGILESFYVNLKDFWKFEVESKFCQKIENFHDSGLSEISDFDHLFKTFHFRLVSQLQVSKWHSKVFLCWFEGFLEVWGWVKILSKFENFHDRGP